MDASQLAPGARFSWSRRVTDEDILRFAELSGDRGRHHVQKDERGRLMAHGLLSATLPTKLGGDMDFIARSMRFEFVRPVYGGDTLTCEGIVESARRKPLSLRLELSFQVRNQEQELVLTGGSSGVVLLEGARR